MADRGDAAGRHLIAKALCPGDRRDSAKHLLRHLAIFRRHDVLTLGEPVRREHLVAQLTKTTSSPAIAAMATGAKTANPALGKFRRQSVHG